MLANPEVSGVCTMSAKGERIHQASIKTPGINGYNPILGVTRVWLMIIGGWECIVCT